jgi:hypothetical protein
LGRGINFQIFVDSVSPLLDALNRHNWALFRECHDAWYRIAGEERGNRQFLVQDPDGYLIRWRRIWGRGLVDVGIARFPVPAEFAGLASMGFMGTATSVMGQNANNSG